MAETCPPQQPVQRTIRHGREPGPKTVVVKECTGGAFCGAQTLLVWATVETTAAYESGAVRKMRVFRSRAWDGKALDRHVFGTHAPVVQTPRPPVFSRYCKRRERFPKLATSSLADPGQSTARCLFLWRGIVSLFCRDYGVHLG